MSVKGAPASLVESLFFICWDLFVFREKHIVGKIASESRNILI